jgi:enamine deaminase RidA (YjgF/YER057c/UK114 family)
MVSAEASLRELGIQLPQAPTPFGAYVEAVQTGDLLFLSGGMARHRGYEVCAARL